MLDTMIEPGRSAGIFAAMIQGASLQSNRVYSE